MILTCPECATRYFLDEDRFGSEARTVRCAGCGASWKARPEAPALDLSTPAHADIGPAPAAEPASAERDEPLPQVFRAKAQARQQTTRAVAAGVVWGGLGAAVAALVIGAIVFRIDVVRLWPRTAGAYAHVGLAVNPVGLSPENIQASPGLQDGHLAVTVTGQLRNIETRQRRPTPVRVTLLDKAGKPLTDAIVRTGSAPIEPGKTAPFSTSFIDPPAAAVNVQVEFVFDDPAAKPAQRLPSSLKLRGPAAPALPAMPAPKPVQALPSASPYALPADAPAPKHEAAVQGLRPALPAPPATPARHG